MINNLHMSLANLLIIGQANLWAIECEYSGKGSE
jgi:hypothetical protein